MLVSFIVSLTIAVALTQVAAFSTTIYLHRGVTHRALVLHPAITWCFRFALWITTGLSTGSGLLFIASITSTRTRRAIRTARS